MKGPRWQYLLQPPAPEGTEIAPGWHCRTVLVGPVHGASPRGMCRGRGKESRTFAARASVAVALKEGGGGGRRGRWAAYARYRRQWPAEAAPYAGTLPSSLAMACGVVAGGSGSLPVYTERKPRPTRTIATQHKHRARPWHSRSFAAIPSAPWRGTGTRRAQARRAAKESTLWRAPWTTSDMVPFFIELS